LAFVFPHILTPVKQEVMAGQFHVPSHPGVLKKVNINGNIKKMNINGSYFTVNKQLLSLMITLWSN